jgi:hypothetical protein
MLICLILNDIYYFYKFKMNRHNFRIEYRNAFNFSIALYNTLLQNVNRLPANCVLEQRRNNSMTVTISFTCDNGHTGHVVLLDPNWTNGGNVQPQIGYVSMLCSVDRFNGYSIERCVENIDQLFEIVDFCQQLLPYQPDVRYLDYVRVPNRLLDHWCVPPHLRELQNVVQNVEQY